MCEHVIEVLADVTSGDQENEEKTEEKEGEKSDKNASDIQLDILKLFAEMSMHSGDLEGIDGKLLKVYNKLVVSMNRIQHPGGQWVFSKNPNHLKMTISNIFIKQNIENICFMECWYDAVYCHLLTRNKR